MFKLLEKTKWENIKEDEVYAVITKATVDIEARIAHGMSIFLSSNNWNDSGEETARPTEDQNLYKLPLNVQNLFITK